MAAVSRFSIKKQTKSISLPSRSHPTTFEIEELLRKMKIITRPSAEAICSSLLQLTRLYKCMDSLLNSSTTQVLMSNQQNKKWVDELVDESVNFLDVCGKVGEMLLELKDQSRDLHCAIRRRKGDMIIESSIMKYNCLRKKMKKDVRGLVASLKQVDNMIISGGSTVVDSDNQHLAAVIKAVIGVSEMTVSVFESLLMFFRGPVSKPNRWSVVVSKLMHKGMVACEGLIEQRVVNEIEKLDATLQMLCKYGKSSDVGNLQIAQCRLERLGVQIENMESGLECTFRCLVRNRVTLLNIISQ